MSDSPAVAWSDEARAYLVVWEDWRSIYGPDIYGQRLGSDGLPIGDEFLIALSGEWDRRPAVVWNATSKDFLVIWETWADHNPQSAGIYGRRVSATGGLGPAFRISDSASSDPFGPSVAWSATADQYLVVWADSRNTGLSIMDSSDIYGQRLTGAGIPVGLNFRVGRGVLSYYWPIGSDTSSDYFPELAWNSAFNEYLVVWETLPESGVDVLGQRVAANGTLLGTAFHVSGKDSTVDQSTPVVAWGDSMNQYLVVWQDSRNKQTRGYDIYAHRVAADGALVGSDQRISGQAATRREAVPVVAWDRHDGVFLVVWEDFRQSSTRGSDIYAQRFNADGTRLGYNFRVCGINATRAEELPAVVWNSNNDQFVVVWNDKRNWSTSSWDIFGRRVAG
jgi:hypothetical protein